MHIIYIHGFNSAGSTNDKTAMLRDYFPDATVHAPDLPHMPTAAILVLVDVLAHLPYDDDVILVGSSLGGFYAHYMSKTFGLKCVLINPSLDPATTLLRMVGPQTNLHTKVDYDLTADDVAILSDYYVDPHADPRVPTLVCLDMGDEVLDSQATADHFKDTAKVLTFDGGNHRFTHFADVLPEIAKLQHVVYQ